MRRNGATQVSHSVRLRELRGTLLDSFPVPSGVSGRRGSNRRVSMGELYGGGGVNPSQNLFNKTICNTLIGHVHRTSTTQKKTGFKEFINTYSTGCLTHLSPKYMPFSAHNHACTSS